MAIKTAETISRSNTAAQILECPFTTDLYADSNNASSIPQDVLDTLPTIIHEKPGHRVVQAVNAIESYLLADLNVDRLNVIHARMWGCGRPLNARALHRQLMLGRKIHQTEQADLHLLYHSDIIYIKPLPAYLLSRATWNLYFTTEKLHKSACGFFLSYIWLLRSPLDFTLARDLHLLPPRLEWTQWRALVSEFLANIDANSLDQVNERYHFGELRLDRINTIYRTHPQFLLKNFVRGYLYGYNRYQAFFQRSVGWLLVVLVWFSLVLSAMQVGVTVPELTNNKAFSAASYGFVIFSIVLVALFLGFVVAITVTVFVFNMFAAIGHARRAERERDDLAGERRGKSKEV